MDNNNNTNGTINYARHAVELGLVTMNPGRFFEEFVKLVLITLSLFFGMKAVLALKQRVAATDANEPDVCPRCFQNIDHRATRCHHCCIDIVREPQTRLDANAVPAVDNDNLPAEHRASRLGSLPPLPLADDNEFGPDAEARRAAEQLEWAPDVNSDYHHNSANSTELHDQSEWSPHTQRRHRRGTRSKTKSRKSAGLLVDN